MVDRRLPTTPLPRRALLAGMLLAIALLLAGPPGRALAAAPVAAAPAAGVFVAPVATFRWSGDDPATQPAAGPGGAPAHWSIAVDGTVVASDPRVADRSLRLTTALRSGSHAWRVISVAADGTELQSPATSFRVDADPPEPVRVTSLQQGATLTDGAVPPVAWSASSDGPGGSGIAGYRLSLDGAEPITTAATARDLATGPLTDGGHAWTVVAVDAVGNASKPTVTDFVVDSRHVAAQLLVLSGTTSVVGRPAQLDASIAPEDSPPILRCEWDFDGDGTFEFDGGTDTAATHAWLRSGSVHPAVRVTDVLGHVSIASASVLVQPRTGEPTVSAIGPVHAPGDTARPTGTGLRARVTISPDGDGIDDAALLHLRTRGVSRLGIEVRSWGGRAAGWHVTWVSRLRTAHELDVAWRGQSGHGRLTRDGAYRMYACWAPQLPARHGHRGAAPRYGPRRCSSSAIEVDVARMTIEASTTTSVAPASNVPVLVEDDDPTVQVSLVAAAGNGAGPALASATVATQVPTWFPMPDAVPPGLYRLRATDARGAVRTAPLVVHDAGVPIDFPRAKTVLVVWPYLTWRAYDAADGDRDGVPDSWYQLWSQRTVSLLGPIVPGDAEHDATQANGFGSWLAARPGLRTQAITDVELGQLDPSVLQRYAAVAFPGHSEYYEQATYEQLLRYRSTGGHLLLLSANGFYRRVELDRGRNVERLVEPVVRRADQSDFLLATTGYADSGEAGGAPWVVSASAVDRLPWLFAGTGLVGGSSFGWAHGEVDRVDALLSPRATMRVASAHLAGSHAPIEADMAYATFPGGGSVFATGSFNFFQGDAAGEQLLANAWTHAVDTAP